MIIIAPSAFDLSRTSLGLVSGTGIAHADRVANAQILRAAIERANGGPTVVYCPFERLEVYWEDGAFPRLGRQGRLRLLGEEGSVIASYPNFAPWDMSAVEGVPGTRITVDRLDLAGPEHPLLVDPILCSYTKGSTTVTRVSGQPFDATYHAGRRVDCNYYLDGSFLNHRTTIASVTSEDEIELADPFPSDAGTLSVEGTQGTAYAGIWVDGEAHASYLVEHGVYWTSYNDDEPAAIRITGTPTQATGLGLVELVRGAKISGAWCNGVEIQSGSSSLVLDEADITAHILGVTLYSFHGARAAGLGSYFHAHSSTIHDTAMVPLGRNTAFWSPVQGHTIYTHPNVEQRFVDCAFRDSKGGWKCGYSESSITETASMEALGCTFENHREGIEGPTVGKLTLRDCDVADMIRTGASVDMFGGTLTDPPDWPTERLLVWIPGNFGSGKDLPGERRIYLRGVGVAAGRRLLSWPGNYDDGQTFYVLMEDCTTVVDQETPVTLVQSPNLSDPADLYTLELRGGSFTVVAGRGLGTMNALQKTVLNGQVALIGDPADGKWITPGDGTLAAEAYDLSGSNTPLLAA